MTFAKVVISGTVASQPEKRFTPNNTAIVNFDLAVTPPPRFNGQVEEPFNIKITCWSRLADSAADSLNPGDQILLEGKLMMVSAQSPEGIQKKNFEIEASAITRVAGTLEDVSGEGQSSGGGQENYSAPRQQPAPAAGVGASVPRTSQAQAGSFPSEEDLTEDDIPF